MNSEKDCVAKEKQLPALLTVLDNALNRFDGILGRYSNMNNNLLGGGPLSSGSDKEVAPPSPGGIVNIIFARVEALNVIGDQIEMENQRLSALVSND